MNCYSLVVVNLFLKGQGQLYEAMLCEHGVEHRSWSVVENECQASPCPKLQIRAARSWCWIGIGYQCDPLVFNMCTYRCGSSRDVFVWTSGSPSFVFWEGLEAVNPSSSQHPEKSAAAWRRWYWLTCVCQEIRKYSGQIVLEGANPEEPAMARARK
jgi:hypothetical protein